MRRTLLPLPAVVASLALLTGQARAQHLWWDHTGQDHATCVYGEITVLATQPHIYCCGVNWHPGEPAGGYCGIQDNEADERRTIFSIWDTSDALHPTSTAMDKRTVTDRFGGEGTGGHKHVRWPCPGREAVATPSGTDGPCNKRSPKTTHPRFEPVTRDLNRE